MKVCGAGESEAQLISWAGAKATESESESESLHNAFWLDERHVSYNNLFTRFELVRGLSKAHNVY